MNIWYINEKPCSCYNHVMPDDAPRIIIALKKINLFRGLDDAQLVRVAAFTHPVQLKEGESLQLNGKNCPLFIVVSGKVRITRLVKGTAGESHVLRQGDFFGADVIFHGKARTYHLITLETSLLFNIPIEPLRSLLNSIPVLTRNIKKQLSWYKAIHSKFFSGMSEGSPADAGPAAGFAACAAAGAAGHSSRTAAKTETSDINDRERSTRILMGGPPGVSIRCSYTW